MSRTVAANRAFVQVERARGAPLRESARVELSANFIGGCHSVFCFAIQFFISCNRPSKINVSGAGPSALNPMSYARIQRDASYPFFCEISYRYSRSP